MIGPVAGRAAHRVLSHALGAIAEGRPVALATVADDPPALLGAATARIGRLLGHHVIVCGAREVFTTRDRFPDAHEVVVDWPHCHLRALSDSGTLARRTVVCALTHDSKFDVPLLNLALRFPLGYVGAMGSPAPTPSGWPGCARQASARRSWPASAPRSAWTSAR